jgi:diguanylate cyclase (GGDEF)-like protein
VRLGDIIDRMTMPLGRDTGRARTWIAKSISREREPFGIAFAKRHLADDLAEMLTAASPEQPLCFAFFDMNGLKTINDISGHEAGDRAIRTFLETVARGVGTRGIVYRGEGGDEVLVALPKTNLRTAHGVVVEVLSALSNCALPVGFPVRCLTASCGLAMAETPSVAAATLQEEADRQMYRAKKVGREGAQRRSTVATPDGDVDVLGF